MKPDEVKLYIYKLHFSVNEEEIMQKFGNFNILECIFV